MTDVLAPELARTIEGKLHALHRARLGDLRIRVDGRREESRVIVRFTVARPDKTLHYPMEAGVPLSDESEDERVREKDATKQIEKAMWLAVDFLGFYLEKYLASGREVMLPLDWKAMRFADDVVYARGWERNLALEEAGDAWLAGEAVSVPETGAERARRRREAGSTSEDSGA